MSLASCLLPDIPPQIYSSYHHQDHHHCLRCPLGAKQTQRLFPFPATAELPKVSCLDAFSKRAAVRCPLPSTLIRLRKVADLKHKTDPFLAGSLGSKSADRFTLEH